MLAARMPPRQTVVASGVLVLVVGAVLAIVITIVVIDLGKAEPEHGWTGGGITLNTSSWTPDQPFMEAGLVGIVRIDSDGCVYVGRRGRPGGSDLIWPAGYTAIREPGGSVSILDPDGVVVAATGHQIRAGGGTPPGVFTEFACRAHGANSWFEIQDEFPPLND
jgi:hypothetical protein